MAFEKELAIMQLEVDDVRAAQLPTAPKLVDIEMRSSRNGLYFRPAAFPVRRKIRDYDHAIAEYATRFSLRL